MNAPDDDMRARLRALAGHEPLGSLSAQQRVLAEQAADAALKPRERAPRAWFFAACSVSLMLASIVCWRVFGEHPRDGSFVAATVTAPPPAPPRCEAFEGRTLEAARLDGRATFSSASEVKVSLSVDCDVMADLSVGSLYVHAAKLEGRALHVRTPHGHVEVRGTVFAVHSALDHFTVEVDEGHVEVIAADGRSFSLRAGQAVRIEALSVQRGPAPLPARNALRAAVGQTPRVAKNVERDAGPDAPTESIWRTGSIPTPSIPPEPGTSLTEDGRPMRKPTLTPGD